jgi:hyperosmotically inducible periplasmic protein
MSLSHETKTKQAQSDEEDVMNKSMLRISVVALALMIALGLTACSSTRTAGTQVDDAAITSAVKAKLAADGDINPFNIDVDTNEGVVTLQGRVEKEEARSKAEQLARGTDGVSRVVNLIKVGDRS